MQIINRHLDGRNRIPISNEFRDQLHWTENEPVTITLLTDRIVIKSTEPRCIFCGEPTTKVYENVRICKDCAEKINK